jgi:translation initiation factor IF-2
LAKNLKLKIKNEQLAQALNLNKIKKTVSDSKEDLEKEPVDKAQKKASEKKIETETAAKTGKAPTKEEAAQQDASKKKAIKATDVPSTFKNLKQPQPAATLKEEKKEEEVILEPKMSLPEKIEQELFKASIKQDVKEVEKETVKPISSLKEPQEVKPVKEQEVSQGKVTPTDQPQKDKGHLFTREIKHEPASFKKEVKPLKPFEEKEEPPKKLKDPKAPPKKFEAQRFDARDRHGLRDGDDESWRRRRYSKHKDTNKVEAVVRPKEISIKLPITVKDLSAAMKVKVSDLITKLFLQGFVLTINDYLEDETIVQLLGVDFDCEIKIDTSEEERLRITEDSISQEIAKTDPSLLKPRAPVVTFMGHVDHGKTSLIDALRKSNIASGEAGAITQHIGAFRCHSSSGDITVLDTPGHEAFKEMRMRGATVTDIVILVIAGDEGMMPQTEEAIKHAKQANVPIVVAINKCDKPTFNPEQVYRQLAEHELLPEAWGGMTITVNCSALSGQGIPQLLEMILLQAEILELKANPNTRARGTVLESQLHRGLGAVANVLIQNGTLKVGDALVFEDIYGRVKTIHDEFGKPIPFAEPSRPVKITGLSGIPEAGCEFIGVDSEKTARAICESREAGLERHKTFGRKQNKELDTLLQRTKELSEKKVLNLILRADVQGSLEALKNSLMKLPSQKVQINFISENVGQISESDIELAAASNSAIIGFHTSVQSHATADISRKKIIVKCHDIIYQLINDVKQMMAEKLDKIRIETEVAAVNVKAIFKSSQLGLIAGCQVAEGTIKRNHHVKVERNKKVIWEGSISSLKRNKDDVKEVAKGLECGILLDRFSELEVGDVIKGFEITYQAQELT